MTADAVETRLFLGNLHRDVTASDIESLLRSFGAVRDVEITRRPDLASFCHATLVGAASQAKSCVRILHRTKWRGASLRVELAGSPRFDVRLQMERDADAAAAAAAADAEVSESAEHLPAPVDKAGGWHKIKGRLMPHLSIAGPYVGAPNVREVPENLITRLKYLSDGPLAPKSKELGIAELHAELASALAASDNARQNRLAAARRTHELRLLEINAKRQLASDRAQLLRKRKAGDKDELLLLPDAEDDTSGSASESFHGEAIPVELSDIGDDSFEAVDEEASVDDFAAARARFQAPNFDDDDSDADADLAAVLKKARKSPPPAQFDDEGPASPPTSPASDAAASVESAAATTTPAPPSRVQVNVPRLRSLFFNVESADPTYKLSDQGVLNRHAATVADTSGVDAIDAVDEAVPAAAAAAAAAALVNDDDEDYEARPVNAALDAGKFSLMPATATDSLLASLFDGAAEPKKAAATPAKAAARPQRVFRLFAPSAKGDETAISPAMQARQASQPVAGIKSAALISQLDRQSKKVQLKAQKQADERAASITKPKPLFDLAAMLAPEKKKPKAIKAQKKQSGRGRKLK
jgi:hypothetical protein